MPSAYDEIGSGMLMIIGSVIAVLALLFAAILNIYVAFVLRTSSDYANVSTPSVLNFLICVVTVILLGAYRKFSPKALQTEKATNFQNGLFFLVCAITSFCLFRSQDFWPSFLGGSGSTKALFENYPNLPVPASGTWFFMVFFGYWVHNLRHLKTENTMTEFGRNVSTILSAGLFLVLFLSNNLRFFLVFSFILSVYNTWYYMDKTLYDSYERSQSAILRVASFVLVMILFVVLKIAVFGTLVVNFWMVDGDTKSWSLKADMNVIRVGLSILLAFYLWWFYDQTLYYLRHRLNMMKYADDKREDDKLVKNVTQS